MQLSSARAQPATRSCNISSPSHNSPSPKIAPGPTDSGKEAPVASACKAARPASKIKARSPSAGGHCARRLSSP